MASAFAEKMRFGLVIDIITTQLCTLVRMLCGITARKFGCASSDTQFNESRIRFRFVERPPLGDHCVSLLWIPEIRRLAVLRATTRRGYYRCRIESTTASPWTVSALFEEAEYHFYT